MWYHDIDVFLGSDYFNAGSKHTNIETITAEMKSCGFLFQRWNRHPHNILQTFLSLNADTTLRSILQALLSLSLSLSIYIERERHIVYTCVNIYLYIYIYIYIHIHTCIYHMSLSLSLFRRRCTCASGWAPWRPGHRDIEIWIYIYIYI